MEPELERRGLENLVLPRRRQGRHRQGLRLVAAERVLRVVAAHPDLPFRLGVERLELVVAERPVLERAAFRSAVGRAHAEILRHVAPRHGAVAQRPAADARGVVRIRAIARVNDALASLQVDRDARVAFLRLRAEGVAEERGALVAKVVLAAVPRGIPAALFEQHHLQSGGREFLRRDASAGAGPDDDGVYLGIDHDFASGLVRARTGRTGTPSIAQLTASRLPPCRGVP